MHAVNHRVGHEVGLGVGHEVGLRVGHGVKGQSYHVLSVTCLKSRFLCPISKVAVSDPVTTRGRCRAAGAAKNTKKTNTRIR